jgi:hypothetical protein
VPDEEQHPQRDEAEQRERDGERDVLTPAPALVAHEAFTATRNRA